MERTELHDTIYDILYDLEDDYVMEVLNNYWERTGGSMRLFPMDEIGDWLRRCSVNEILDIGLCANYEYGSAYFMSGDVGYVEQFYDGLSIDEFEDLDEIADYIIKHNTSLGDDDIADALKEGIA